MLHISTRRPLDSFIFQAEISKGPNSHKTENSHYLTVLPYHSIIVHSHTIFYICNYFLNCYISLQALYQIFIHSLE